MKSLKLECGTYKIEYPVHIDENAYAHIGDAIKPISPSSIFIISNKNVMDLHGEKLLSGLKKAGFDPDTVLMGDGEEHKTPDEVVSLCTRLIEKGIDRNSLLIAFGGGVTGDTGGFAAATVMRGVKYIQVPTTLVAQVDASIGGKVGVNLQPGKNLFGAFHHPEMVLINPRVLYTLPESEFSSGIAEVIKSAIIGSPQLMDLLEEIPAKLDEIPYDKLEKIVCHTVNVKSDIVSRDVYESGERMKLNLGHTLGHGIESASGYKSYSHGQAIALGILASIGVSGALGLLEDDNLENRVLKLLKKFGLPVSISKVNIDKILNFVRMDKKREMDKIRYIVPRRIGLVEVVDIFDDCVFYNSLVNLKEE
ncbi:MAG: 3-dehydroquinate synthase [Candidatus Eremiobacteraeota bacterium]|nr:3-dehydroquinate synthase [Candidatus Eremiobacteraeota bacterium]